MSELVRDLRHLLRETTMAVRGAVEDCRAARRSVPLTEAEQAEMAELMPASAIGSVGADPRPALAMMRRVQRALGAGGVAMSTGSSRAVDAAESLVAPHHDLSDRPGASASRSAAEAVRREIAERLADIEDEFPDHPWWRADNSALIRPLLAGWTAIDVHLWMCAPHPALHGRRPVDLLDANREELEALIPDEARGV